MKIPFDKLRAMHDITTMSMRIETLPHGTRIVKRYRKGRCYAAVFSPDTNDRQIESAVLQGEAAFFPYNESNGQFLWGQTNRPSYFRK